MRKSERKDYIYVTELKLTKNGGISAAEKQITANKYLEQRKVVGLAIELDNLGKGLRDWKMAE